MQNPIWGRLALALLLASQLGSSAIPGEPTPNTLTSEEKDAGWKLLFDGKTTTDWRGLGKPTFPTNGWTIADGWLNKVAGQAGGNIITLEEFSDFELSWEWRIPTNANNGIKYMLLEERGAIGHEYQMLDDRVRVPPKQKQRPFMMCCRLQSKHPRSLRQKPIIRGCLSKATMLNTGLTAKKCWNTNSAVRRC